MKVNLTQKLLSLILSGSIFLGVGSGFIFSRIFRSSVEVIQVVGVPEAKKHEVKAISNTITAVNSKLDRIIRTVESTHHPHKALEIPPGMTIAFDEQGYAYLISEELAKQKRRELIHDVGGPSVKKKRRSK